jgi:hypothetical protein
LATWLLKGSKENTGRTTKQSDKRPKRRKRVEYDRKEDLSKKNENRIRKELDLLAIINTISNNRHQEEST